MVDYFNGRPLWGGRGSGKSAFRSLHCRVSNGLVWPAKLPSPLVMKVRVLHTPWEVTSRVAEIQGGSNMTGTNSDLFAHKQSRSYLNHLVVVSVGQITFIRNYESAL